MDRSAEVVVSLQISRVQEQVMSTGGSLDDLYDQHARSLYRYALALTSSPEDAEDAVQEVFVGLARQRNCDRLARISNIRAYLLKAARNAA
ncbi:MAG TPA: sigma factor, partial [Armatimonadota bacterium]|nr:sigma factor [Armatimonadota bacterium]